MVRPSFSIFYLGVVLAMQRIQVVHLCRDSCVFEGREVPFDPRQKGLSKSFGDQLHKVVACLGRNALVPLLS